MIATRCKKLAEFLPHKTDAALICSAHNRLYLSGFCSSAGALLVTRQETLFLTDGRYIEAAQKRIGHIRCLCSDRLYDDVAAHLQRLGIKRLFVEAEQMTVAQLSAWKKSLPAVAVQSDDALDRRLLQQRLVKDAQELAALRQAQAITDAAFTHILTVLRPGLRERDIAVELDSFMRRNGAQDVSFRTIAAAGANTSLPHAEPGDYAIQSGDFVTMDFGALLDGYHADMTRTVAVGTPSEQQKEIYDIVLRAQQKALHCLRAGIDASQADAAARNVIDGAGYGAYFGHSTGHGVGVEIHEGPTLSTRSHTVLPVGCVVTVEPGIYLPGRFGVRIEDMALVTEDGCINLTASPKQLICL